MTRTRVRSVALLVSMLAASLLSRPLTAADKVPSDQLLPPKVYGYLSVPSVAELKERFKQSTLGGVLKDESFDDFWAELKPVIEKASGDITEQLGVSVDELLQIPTGEVAVAYIEPEGETAGLVALLDFGESGEVIEKLLEKAEGALEEQGVARSVEDFEGTEIVTYRFKKKADADAAAEEPDEDGFGRTLAYFLKDDYLVAGSNLPVLEAVLARWSGDHSSTFSSNEVYRHVMERTKSPDTDPVLKFYIDPIGLATNLINAFAQDNFQLQMATGFLPAMGLANLKAIGGAVDMVSGDFDTVSRVFIYVEQPAVGLLNAFRFPAVEQTPPPWVADNVNTYFALNWDVESAYEAVEALADSIQGPGALEQMLDQMAEKEGGLQLHLKTDVLDQLTGEIHFVSDMEDPKVPDSSRFMLALGVKDPKQAKTVLSTIADSDGISMETREFRGEKIYEMQLPLPSVGGLGQGADPVKMGITVAKNSLMIASNVTLLEQALRDSDVNALSDSKEYQQIADHFPSQTSIMGFQNQSSQLKAAYELFRSGTAGDFLENVDFSKLPPFEAIEKYMPASGSYVIPDEKGALMVSFSLPKD